MEEPDASLKRGKLVSQISTSLTADTPKSGKFPEDELKACLELEM